MYFILSGLHIACGEAIPGGGLPYLIGIAIGQYHLRDSLDEIMKSEPSNEIKETIMRIYDDYITFSLYFYLFVLTVMKIVLSAAS